MAADLEKCGIHRGIDLGRFLGVTCVDQVLGELRVAAKPGQVCVADIM